MGRTMQMRFFIAAVAILLSGMSGICHGVEARYTITDLGTFAVSGTSISGAMMRAGTSGRCRS